MQDDTGSFQIELTWLKDHPQPYELGENESHIAFATDDFEAAHRLHEEMGCICFENKEMGIYFIHDPDDYWLEVVPHRTCLIYVNICIFLQVFLYAVIDEFPVVFSES